MEKHQNLGKVRVNNTGLFDKVDVVTNVVCKKYLKNVKKPSKNGKVRVRNTFKPVEFSYFQLKREGFIELLKRKSYNKCIFSQKERENKCLRPKLMILNKSYMFLNLM